MKRDIPKEFLVEYISKKKIFESTLEKIKKLLKLRLGQLAAQKGVRARLTDARIKRPAKLWKNANKAAFTLEEFIEMLESGSVPVEALKELGGIEDCTRCGTEILSPYSAAEAVLDYYGNPHTDVDLEVLFMDSEKELESVDFSGVCQYCGYQMSKDD